MFPQDFSANRTLIRRRYVTTAVFMVLLFALAAALIFGAATTAITGGFFAKSPQDASVNAAWFDTSGQQSLSKDEHTNDLVVQFTCPEDVSGGCPAASIDLRLNGVTEVNSAMFAWGDATAPTVTDEEGGVKAMTVPVPADDTTGHLTVRVVCAPSTEVRWTATLASAEFESADVEGSGFC